MAVIMALSPSARAASLYSCAGTNTDVCDPAGTDVCTPTPGGLWDCFTAVAGETLGPPGATTYTVYDAAGAISGTADSYVTYGVESLGNAFCCSVASGGVNDIFVHSGLDGDTLSLQDTALGLELQEGSLGILQARASGGDGNDDIFGSGYAGAAYSEDLSGNNNVDYIEAHAGDDDISLGNSVDECDAGDGADLVDGGLGFDKIEAGTGDDTVVGGDGSDTVNGDAGLDDINGGLARDFLSGDDDADIVWGGALNDAMCGDASVEIGDVDLDGGTGNDTIWGDSAADAGTGGLGTNLCSSNATGLLLCTSHVRHWPPDHLPVTGKSEVPMLSLLFLTQLAQAACPDSGWVNTCYTLRQGAEDVSLGAFDPDVGEVCSVTSPVAADLGLPAALAVVGTDAWFCSNGQVIALSLTDGALTETGVACESIASDGTSLVVINGPPTLTAVYASPARALVSPPDATFSLIGATRAATDGRYWYGLRHAGGLLRTHDGATGAFLGTAPLEGFDGWVWGISALDGVLLVLDDGRPTRGGTWGEPTLRRFDPVSGAALGATSLGRTQGIALRGLWCSAS